ncbi:MAG: AAA family ATPase [Clostridiaceae bacterium]|nr:AAA family ATPase [Clostridiaceae bacterium]
MWLLLKENTLNNFNIDNRSTYLFKIDKTNFLVGKNNSGKSYFLRFLLTNSLRIYSDISELSEDLKKIILTDNSINFDFFSEFNNIKINKLYKEYYKYVNLLDKANENKIDTGSTYLMGNTIKAYQYTDENELMKNLEPLFEFLKIEKRIDKLNIEIIAKYEEIKIKILKCLKEELVKQLDILQDEDIIKFGSKMGNRVDEKIEKYYFPILRNIRHPLKSAQNIYDENTRRDIYKERIVSEYNFNDNIEIITGLNFYQDYKKNLLGTKEKREKINKFEKFLSSYFFNGETVSIIPDEETFELKININDDEDKFIYQVGDGITSLLIIMYTIFMECDENKYKLFYIEEPENSFHAGYQRLFINMITYFKEFKKCIFIISTHSNNLIDIGNRENKNSLIYLCKKENGEINISEKNEEYYDVIEELGVTASSVLIANKAIWIEGKYDAFYIRLLLNLKNINIEDTEKFMEDYDYCFIPYGGKNMSLINFLPQNVEEISKEFIAKAKKINPKYMIILDDDNMFEEGKEAKSKNFQKLSKKLGKNIYKLEVREIENLFPKEVVEMYIEQGIKKDIFSEELIKKLDINYEEYKKRKLGEYINEKLLEKFKNRNLKSITGRENGFLKNGFLYDKSKFYKCVVEWSKKLDFNYEKEVTIEAKELIGAVEKFIKKK